uniref:EOG090X0M0J n=1 Tax=Daphnia lumholtzi TaxID=42856 RepID=A0A4Y7MI60_9CRUS|nr:EOG090X0M0J [Daphnia lumholtzi]SVE78026.1 EOG090X0M0J [Daphnia lumholtzi]SVE78654.1 EOG090X0M0J [Daphnia lumholtzi]SVE79285.1 EOG090X0M0J [Daphnia lumholtzi]
MDPEWKVDCSDDENYGLSYSSMCQQWIPSPAAVVQLFESYTSEKDCKLLTLDWVSPGRKEVQSGEVEGYTENEELKTEEKSDFDFWDEPSATTKPGPTRVGPGMGVNKQPRGSAKKKTTSLDGILSSMRRHRKLDQLEKPSPTQKPT